MYEKSAWRFRCISNTAKDNVPVVRISDDDPDIIAAVEEAKTRWPEFRAAFDARRPDQRFAIKAKLTVDDSTEFIWVDVDGLEPNFIHGTLANDRLPRRPEDWQPSRSALRRHAGLVLFSGR